ncbi:MAG: sugar transferase [Calditrichia bacterium]
MVQDATYIIDYWIKRIFDILFALVALVLLLPLMVLIAIAIYVTSPGPIFYGSPRVGQGGKVFKMTKFRTMIPNADKVGPLVTAGNDPRITKVGRYLRKLKWDELPTLWHVLIGDMSIVGPRPENPKSVGLYTEEQKKVLSVKPGITSLATLKYRREEEILENAHDLEAAYYQIMQDKLSIELEYIKNRSFIYDLKIIFLTVIEVIFG